MENQRYKVISLNAGKIETLTYGKRTFGKNFCHLQCHFE
jgi:hypothetical protein